MGFGASLVLIAAGAVLWAVSVDGEGVNLNTVGVILFVVGAVGLLLSLLFWSSRGGVGSWRRERYVERDASYGPGDPAPRDHYRERERTY